MIGTRVTCTDLDTGETGETEETVITDNYVLVCDGASYLHSEVRHANGTTVLTIKRRTP